MAGEMKTWLLLFLLFATVGIAAGCKASSSGTSSPTPIPTQSSRAGVDVVGLGDDFTVGLGTTTCGVPPGIATACNTSPSDPGVGTSVNPQGWAQMFDAYVASTPRWEPSTFVGLGVNFALSGDAPKPEGPGGDLLTNSSQVPQLSGFVRTIRSTNIKTLIVIQSGVNDVLDAFYSDTCTGGGGTLVGGGGATYAAPCTASGTTLAPGGNARNGTLYAAYSTMLATMTTFAGGEPEGVLIVGVPNLGRFPFCITQFGGGSAQCTALTNDAQLANTAIQDAIADAADKQVAFADWYTFLETNPTYYGATYFATDGLHLDNGGNVVLAQQVVEPALLAAVGAGTFNMSKAVAAPGSAR